MKNVLEEIRSLENDYVLNASPMELEEHYVAKASLTPLVADFEAYYIDNKKGTRYEVTGDFRRMIEPGERAFVPGTRIEIAIPFTGDSNLLRYRPSRFGLATYAQVDVRGDHIFVPFAFPDDTADGARLKADIDRSILWLKESLETLQGDVERHNKDSVPQVKQALEAKRNRAMQATDAVASLGIPIKHAAQPPTFAVPAKRRPSPIHKPQAPRTTYCPEWEFRQEEYEHTLAVLRSMSLVIERNPTTFARLKEETIRDLFLVTLNGHYPGEATGETFNGEGKTDILLRHERKNAFIAECKFWHGPKAFGEGVDQLLSYLVWRDCKCALMMFNRTKNTSAVAAKMHQGMEARPEHRRTVSHDIEGDSRYVFVKDSDPGKDIIITTQIYDIPCPESSTA